MNVYVIVIYFNESSNYIKIERCECGVYGLVLLVVNVMGVVGIFKNGNY